MEVQHKFWWVEASLPHLSIFPFFMEDPILHMVVSLSKADLVRILPRDAVFNKTGRVNHFLPSAIRALGL